MTETPFLEISVFGDEPSPPIARGGPFESWDFEPFIQEVLANSAPKGGEPEPKHLRIVCTGRYSGSTPSFGLGRLTIGQLISRNASIELHLARRASGKEIALSSSPPRMRIEFSLETRDDFDPHEISRLVRLEPSRQIRKGELQWNGKTSVSTRWAVSTPDVHGESFDMLLKELLSRLEPQAGAISSLTRDKLDGVLSLIGHISGEEPTVRFTEDQLRLVRQLGLEIDVDLLV